jgi:seryl-tRNA synthetase
MDENQVEVTVEVTEPNPSEPTEPNPNPPQSVEMIVGTLTAQVEQLQAQVQALAQTDERIQNLVEEVQQIQRWSQEEIRELATTIFQEMSQMRSDVEELSESETETIEEESVNLSEIPAIPEPAEQEEPEIVETTSKRRPWFL